MVRLSVDFDAKIEKLTSNFKEYANNPDIMNKFSGPMRYFHRRTVEKLRNYNSLDAAFGDSLFFEYLYATLAAWGLHYRGAKLVNFDVFQERVKKQQNSIMKLQNKSILTLIEEEIPELIENLWEIIENISVSESQTQLIAGSKTLHHLLPRIIPPIDRGYSLRFFYGEGRSPSCPNKQTFNQIYPHYHKIALKNRNAINSLLGKESNTSETKTIDNAIVGFILEEIETKKSMR